MGRSANVEGWAEYWALREAPQQPQPVGREPNYHMLPVDQVSLRDFGRELYPLDRATDTSFHSRIAALAATDLGRRAIVRLEQEGAIPAPIPMQLVLGEPPPADISPERRAELLGGSAEVVSVGTGNSAAATIKRLRAEGQLPPEQS
jgi:hypothetical protein